MSHALLPPKGARDPLGAVEQAAAAEEILSTARHDLRNRLATVRNAVYYIKRKLVGSEVSEKDARIVQFLDTIDHEMITADATISEGRASAHLGGERAPRASALECVERAIRLSRIEEPSIRFDAAIEDGALDMDPDTLAMAVRCLIENAAEAMPGGGGVTIRAAPHGPAFRIEVTDEGHSLAEDAGDIVFQAFSTTKPGHVGLGLPMASRAARRAGGQLSVRRGPSGAVAALLIPLSTHDAPRPGKESGK